MDGTPDQEHRDATRAAMHDADVANGEPDAAGDDSDVDTDADAPGAGIQRDVEPPEPNEPA